MLSRASPLLSGDYINLGKREYQLCPPLQDFPFPFDEFILEMPRQHKVVIRIQLARLRLANNWNVRTQCVDTVLFGASFRGTIDDPVVDAAPNPLCPFYRPKPMLFVSISIQTPSPSVCAVGDSRQPASSSMTRVKQHGYTQICKE